MQEQKIYEKLKQEIDKEYKKSEERYNRLVMQIGELENKPDKSELEQVKLDFLKAQEVQFSFQRAQGKKEKFEELMGDVMLADLNLQSNILISFFIAFVSGILTGAIASVVFQGVSDLVHGESGDDYWLITGGVIGLALLIIGFLGFFEKWGGRELQKTRREIIEDYPMIFKDFEDQIDIKKEIKRTKIYSILFQRIFK